MPQVIVPAQSREGRDANGIRCFLVCPSSISWFLSRILSIPIISSSRTILHLHLPLWRDKTFFIASMHFPPSPLTIKHRRTCFWVSISHPMRSGSCPRACKGISAEAEHRGYLWSILQNPCSSLKVFCGPYI